jgi:hypothetical protein
MVRRRLLKFSVFIAALGLATSACSKSSPPAASASSAPASPSSSAAAIPTATTVTLPVTYGFYDGHVDTMLSTDVSNKAQASAKHINYSADLRTESADKFPSLYLINGTAAAGQPPQVFGTEPGETDYSPLWQEVDVRWKKGVKPVLLVKDDQIKELVGKGKLTMTPTPIVLNCPIVRVSSSATVPSASTITLPVTYGYYDGHVDTMISTDVSDKAQASAKHINYSAALVTQSADKYPSLYLVNGAAAAGQPPQVFGSEPGEDDYSPLWQEVNVQWKAGVTPVLLVKDDQVKELASQGKLTVTSTTIVLNCPIVKVS